MKDGQGTDKVGLYSLKGLDFSLQGLCSLPVLRCSFKIFSTVKKKSLNGHPFAVCLVWDSNHNKAVTAFHLNLQENVVCFKLLYWNVCKLQGFWHDIATWFVCPGYDLVFFRVLRDYTGLKSSWYVCLRMFSVSIDTYLLLLNMYFWLQTGSERTDIAVSPMSLV